MKVYVVCGGYGTRMRTILGDTPKSLCYVDAQRTLLDLQLAWLGQTPVHFCLGHGYEAIQRKLSTYSFRYSSTVEKPRGVIAALVHARPKEDSFGILLGDVLPQVPLQELLDAGRREISKGKSIMYISDALDVPGQRGNVSVLGSHIVYSKNQAFRGQFVDIGFWVLRRDHLTVRHFDEEAFFRDLIQHNLLSTCWVSKRSWEVGSPYGLRQIQKSFGEVQIPNEDHN